MPDSTSIHDATRAPLRKPLAMALIAALGVAPALASAAVITVNSPGDTDPAVATTCTLRQAIATANHGATAGTDEGLCRATLSGTIGLDDAIVFDPATFPRGGPNVIALAQGRLEISSDSLTIDAGANGRVSIDANHASGVLIDSAATGARLMLNHLALRDGRITTANCYGYAQGAGICAPYANVTVTASTISGNDAQWGAGIYAHAGSITVIGSTLYDNTAGKSGGAIYSHDGDIHVINSTLSGNYAINGGAIYTREARVTLASSTISANVAGSLAGGVYTEFNAASIVDSIVAGNVQASGGDIYGATPTGSGNLLGAVANLGLGPLADHGGPTPTLLPQAGSVAIDAIACSDVSGSDQRGAPRPDPGNASPTPCDIGAVEANSDPDEIFRNGFGL